MRHIVQDSGRRIGLQQLDQLERRLDASPTFRTAAEAAENRNLIAKLRASLRERPWPQGANARAVALWLFHLLLLWSH